MGATGWNAASTGPGSRQLPAKLAIAAPQGPEPSPWMFLNILIKKD